MLATLSSLVVGLLLGRGATTNRELTVFIQRLLKATSCEPATCLCALKYLQRFLQIYFPPSPSDTRLFLASLIVSDSFYNDNAYSMASWAEISGFPLDSVIRMKTEFLFTLEFHLTLPLNEFSIWLKELEIYVHQYLTPPSILTPTPSFLDVYDKSAELVFMDPFFQHLYQ
jgi:hypothetical protein